MKIIKHGIKLEQILNELTCRKCKAVVLASRSELEHVFDQRDGNYYILTCPECQYPTTYSADLIK